MFNNCHRGNETKIVIKDNKMRCGKQEAKLPKYTNISGYLEKLRETRSVLTKEYSIMYNDILNDKTVNKTVYDKIVKDIEEIDNRISELNENKMDIDIGVKRGIIVEKMNDISQSDKQLIESMNTLNPNLYKLLIENHKLKRKLFEDLKDIGEATRKDYIKETYTDIKLREDIRLGEDIKDSPIKEKKKITKTKAQKLSDVQKIEIKDNIKELLKKVYKFKDRAECVSKQRTKPYYMSKEDIIKEIDSNSELKKLMPSNFRSLSKDKLCELLLPTY